MLAALCAVSSCSAQDNRGSASAGNLNYELSASASTVSHSIDATARQSLPKFVRVTLGTIANPTRASLSFQVYFRSVSGERIQLGTFSPFPADNPGVFIVSTQGKVAGKGVIEVSMTVADKTTGTPTSVRIKSIELVDN